MRRASAPRREHPASPLYPGSTPSRPPNSVRGALLPERIGNPRLPDHRHRGHPAALERRNSMQRIIAAGQRTALDGAPSPRSNHTRVPAYNFNSAEKRHSVRPEAGRGQATGATSCKPFGILRTQATGQVTVRGNCYALFSHRTNARIPVVALFGFWPQWCHNGRSNSRVLVVAV